MQLSYEELRYLHDMILFQNLIDHKNRKMRDHIHNEIIKEMERLESIMVEDKEDAKHRRKIVK